MVCRYIGVEPRPGSYHGSEVLAWCQAPFRTTFAGGCICTIARDGFHRNEAVHDIFMMGFSYDDPFMLNFITIVSGGNVCNRWNPCACATVFVLSCIDYVVFYINVSVVLICVLLCNNVAL